MAFGFKYQKLPILRLVLEVTLEDKGRTEATYESQFLRADKDAKEARDWVACLEEEKKTLTASKARLQSTIDELRSVCTIAEQDKSRANQEIKGLKYEIARHDKERCTTEIILKECLQRAGISPPKPEGRKHSKSTQKRSGKSFHLKLFNETTYYKVDIVFQVWT